MTDAEPSFWTPARALVTIGAILLIVVTVGCVSTPAETATDAAVRELRAAVNAQNAGLGNITNIDSEFVDGKFVVYSSDPAGIMYAHEKFVESAEHVERAKQHLGEARRNMDNSEDLLMNGRMFQAALIVDNIAQRGISLTTELGKPSPNATSCMVDAGLIERYLPERDDMLRLAGVL
ncbi:MULTISPECIES: hypothetical protein [unclassified Methanoculleus]|jgi:hypothetical protein|uniref:hypothetical protein n=1 Tax=unclassified Methanoculleus TaxID=2619537 RepID=UPI0026333AFE|nr:hypothetical protein [Methanoculleus sp.]MDI6867863.1 hypothetical protein [Methanoculleus sp.]